MLTASTLEIGATTSLKEHKLVATFDLLKAVLSLSVWWLNAILYKKADRNRGLFTHFWTVIQWWHTTLGDLEFSYFFFFLFAVFFYFVVFCVDLCFFFIFFREFRLLHSFIFFNFLSYILLTSLLSSLLEAGFS